MTTPSIGMKQTSFPLPKLPIWILIFLALALSARAFFMGSLTSPHGQKHDESHEIRKCLENGGARSVMFNKADNRWAFLCLLGDGKWGFRSIGVGAKGEWYQATAFVNTDACATLSELKEYLSFSGYKSTTSIMGVSASPSELYAMLIQAGVIP